MSGRQDISMYNARPDQSSSYKHCGNEISFLDIVINCYVSLSCDGQDVILCTCRTLLVHHFIRIALSPRLCIHTCCSYRFTSHTISFYIVRWMTRQAWPKTALSHVHKEKVRRHRARTARRCHILPDHCFGFQWVVKQHMIIRSTNGRGGLDICTFSVNWLRLMWTLYRETICSGLACALFSRHFKIPRLGPT